MGADEALKQRLLPMAATGEALGGAFALTEPQAGSNPADMRSTATREGDGYRLKGSKCFISNAGGADFIVVYAKTDTTAGARGVSAFVVEPRETDGVEIGKHEQTMGLRGGHVFPVSFDCYVPADNLLGAEGTGFRTAMKVLDNGRIEVAAQATGIAKAALDAAVSYAKERTVGGHPIGDFQGLQWMLADCATELAAARALGGCRPPTRGGDGRALFIRLRICQALCQRSGLAHCRPRAANPRRLRLHTRLPIGALPARSADLQDLRGSSEIQRTIIARDLLK